MTSRSDLYSIVSDVISAVHADHRKNPNWPNNAAEARKAIGIHFGVLQRIIYLGKDGDLSPAQVDQIRAAAVLLAASAVRFVAGLDSYRSTQHGFPSFFVQDLTPPWKGAPEWGGAESVTLYATDDEVFKYDTLTEALHSILDEPRELIAGETTVYECTFAPYDPAEAFDLDTIIEQANEKADDDAGYDDADNLFEHRISDADAMHLQGLLSAWARKHASERRLKPIGGLRAIVLTEADINEFLQGQNGTAVSVTEQPAQGIPTTDEIRSRSSHG